MKTIRGLGVLCAISVLALTVSATPQMAAAGQKWCPPGLAKKGCVPPGQRKKWSAGHRLPDDVRYRTIYDWERYDLGAPPRGYFYGYVDNDILLIEAATRMVVDAVVQGILLN